MAIVSLLDLRTQVRNFLEWDTTLSDTQINTFVTLTESMINGDLIAPPQAGGQGGVNRQLTQVPGSPVFTVASSTLALPADFLGVKTFRFINGSTWVTPDYFTEESLFANNINNASDVPAGYTVRGSNIILQPPPDSAYVYTLIYFAKVPALVNDADTNWIMANFPDCYLYGTLVTADIFLQNMQAKDSAYAGGYNLALGRIRADSNRASYPSGPIQMKITGTVT